MIPGRNSSIRHAGIEYHVQTEDLDRRPPCILSLVYRRGAIVARKQTTYHETVGESASEDQIRRFLEEQHLRILQSILVGHLPELTLPDDLLPVSQPHESDHPLPDSVNRLIVEYLRRRAGRPR
jgi:hypothetical protein